MPCRDDRDSCNTNHVNDALQASVASLEVLLCSACTQLELQKHNFAVNPALDTWWSNHKKEDEAAEDEKIRKKVRTQLARTLALLTPIARLTEEDKKLMREEGFL
jgi:hypothetical protein